MIKEYKCRFTKQIVKAVIFDGNNKEKIDAFLKTKGNLKLDQNDVYYSVILNTRSLFFLKIKKWEYLILSEAHGYYCLDKNTFETCFYEL